jgi:pyruvate formate-lyase activating enzyme-like uncharacterized protein
MIGSEKPMVGELGRVVCSICNLIAGNATDFLNVDNLMPIVS